MIYVTNLMRTNSGIKTPGKSVIATWRKLYCVMQIRYQNGRKIGYGGGTQNSRVRTIAGLT